MVVDRKLILKNINRLSNENNVLAVDDKGTPSNGQYILSSPIYI